MFGSLNISTSGMVAQRVRMDVVAGNIANASTTVDAAGRASPYRRRVATFAPGDPGQGPDAAGVHVSAIAQDPSAFRLVHDHYGHQHTGPKSKHHLDTRKTTAEFGLPLAATFVNDGTSATTGNTPSGNSGRFVYAVLLLLTAILYAIHWIMCAEGARALLLILVLAVHAANITMRVLGLHAPSRTERA